MSDRFHRNAQSITEANLQQKSFTYVFLGCTLYESSQQLFFPSKLPVSLSTAEFNLLMIFLTHPQQTLSREQLLALSNRLVDVKLERQIDVLIRRIRQKFEPEFKGTEIIRTVRHSGYLFVPTVIQTTR